MGNIVDISEVILMLGLESSVTERQRAVIQSLIASAEGAIKRHLKYDPVYAQRTEYYPMMDTATNSRDSIWEVNATHAYERYLSDASSDELQIQHIPIRSITSLKIDYDGRSGTRPDSFGSDTLKILGEDYWPNFDSVDSDGDRVCKDGIIKSVGLWPNVAGSVQVIYYAGYKEAELRGTDSKIDASPIHEATMDEVVRRFHKMMSRSKGRAGFGGPLTSENLGDYSYSRDSALYARLVGGTDLMPETREKLADYENYGWSLMS